MTGRSPIALFVYNRLWHTRQTIDALLKNKEASATHLFVFSDGPKTEADAAKVQEIRDYVTSLNGFAKIDLIASEQNKGLANSIIGGVTKVLETNDTVIVMEDDLVTSPFFLQYMNEALALYRDDEAVVSIHGYVYPVKQALPETFFLRGADCWGWATWKRGWKLFEPDGQKLLNELKQRHLVKDFDMDGHFPYTDMLKDQIAGRVNSWAIRWHASAFLQNKFTLYPGTSLVNNIGFDNSGTHSGNTDAFSTKILDRPVELKRLDLREDTGARTAVKAYFKEQRRSWPIRVASRIRNILRKKLISAL